MAAMYEVFFHPYRGRADGSELDRGWYWRADEADEARGPFTSERDALNDAGFDTDAVRVERRVAAMPPAAAMSDDEIASAARFTERCLRLEREALFPELKMAVRTAAAVLDESANLMADAYPRTATLFSGYAAEYRALLARIEEAGL
jgi:hypothetical protein